MHKGSSGDLENACLSKGELQPIVALQARRPGVDQYPNFILSGVPNPDFYVNLLIFKYCQQPEKNLNTGLTKQYILPVYSQQTCIHLLQPN